MHPLSFIKAHPVATVTLLASGMVFGPWLLSGINRATGVGVNLPSYGGSAG